MELKPSLPPLLEKKETRESLSFPEEMYTISGFDSPIKDHYERSRRFDEAVLEGASLSHQLDDCFELPEKDLLALFDNVFATKRADLRLRAIEKFYLLSDEALLIKTKELVALGTAKEKRACIYKN